MMCTQVMKGDTVRLENNPPGTSADLETILPLEEVRVIAETGLSEFKSIVDDTKCITQSHVCVCVLSFFS